MRKTFVFLAFVLLPASGHAQTAALALPRHDATVAIGWFGRDYPDANEYGTGWHQSLLAGVGGGHYWTDHLKTEAELSWIRKVSTRSYQRLAVENATAYISSSYRFQDIKFSVAQAYQFGRNAWVHPYVAAGLDVDHLRAAEDRPKQTVPLYNPSAGNSTGSVVIPGFVENETSVQVQPFVKAGFKMYASDRTFFTTEWKFGLGNGIEHALWKTGIGVDF